MNKYLQRLCGTEFCWKEVELSVACLVRDLKIQKENRSFVFLQSSLFLLYSLSCITKRKSRPIPFPGERRKYFLLSSLAFLLLHNREAVLPRAVKAVPRQYGPRSKQGMSPHLQYRPTPSSEGEGAVLMNSEHAKDAKHPMPCYLCSFFALTLLLYLSWRFLSFSSNEEWLQPSY